MQPSENNRAQRPAHARRAHKPGRRLREEGELDAALTEYETASKSLPAAFLYMGNVSFEKKEFGKAEGLYKKAISRTQDPRAYNNLAWLYYTTGKDLEKAEELARKAVDLSPDSPEFTDTLAKIVERRDRKLLP